MKTRKLALLAMLISMNVVLGLFSVNMGNMKLTFDALPILIAAFLFGAKSGFMVGLIGAFMSQMLTFGLMPTTIIWILPAAIRGLTVGLYAQGKAFNLERRQIMFITILTSLFVTFLNTLALYADSMIYGYYSYTFVFGMVIPRIFAGVLTAILFSGLMPEILAVVNRVYGKTVKAI